jgi:hypothetical protein
MPPRCTLSLLQAQEEEARLVLEMNEYVVAYPQGTGMTKQTERCVCLCL